MLNKQFFSRLSSLFIVLTLLFGGYSADAQSRSKKDDDKKEDKFKDHLWYGGSVNIGFSGYNGYNTFQFGLSPMAGYKLTEWFSIGPRIGMDYIFQKVPIGNNAFDNVNLFRFEPGLFARAKVFRGVFVHAEQSLSIEQIPFYANTNPLTVEKESRSYPNTYLGLGLNQSNGAFGYDIYLLYNFEKANDVTSSQLPFDYRFGVTWNF